MSSSPLRTLNCAIALIGLFFGTSSLGQSPTTMPGADFGGPANRPGFATTSPRVHDPCAIAEGDAVYIFSTGNGIPVWRSTDLYNWERRPTVFNIAPAWGAKEVPGSRGPWAPDISFFNGKYHLYYSISTFGSRRSCIGLAMNKTLDSKSPDYKWDDHGKIFESFEKDNFNSIDPNVVFDEKGSPWLALGSCWSGLKMRRLDAATGKLSDADTKLYDLATRPGGKLIEAPFITRHGEYFYLFVSFDACCKGVNSTYKTMVGRSKTVTGPYRDAEGVPMLRGGGTLVLAGQGNVYGPGHNGVLSNYAGQDWLVHHFYAGDDRGRSHLQVRPITWDKDGWPVAGEAVDEPVKKAHG